MPRKPIGNRPMTDAERQARRRPSSHTDTTPSRPSQPRPTLARHGRRAGRVASRIRSLARSPARHASGHRDRRGAAHDQRARPQRAPGDRPASSVRSRLTDRPPIIQPDRQSRRAALHPSAYGSAPESSAPRPALRGVPFGRRLTPALLRRPARGLPALRRPHGAGLHLTGPRGRGRDCLPARAPHGPPGQAVSFRPDEGSRRHHRPPAAGPVLGG